MSPEKALQLFRDENIEPVLPVLEAVLSKELYGVYLHLMEITQSDLDLQPEWRYYKDGKVWLCKFVYKKKTILWLSLWETYIKVSFYFTEKTRDGIFNLSIDESLKADFRNTTPIGKLIPLILDIRKDEQLSDFGVIIEYKKSLK